MSTNDNFRIIRHLSVPVIVTDTRGKILFVNLETCKFTGFNENELLGKYIGIVAKTVWEDFNFEVINNDLIVDGKWKGMFTLIKKDKTEIPALITLSPFFNEKDEIVGVIGSPEIIDDEKEIERKIIQYKENFASIFNNIRDAIIIFNMNGEIVEVNPSALELYGYSYQEMVGKNGEEVIHETYHKRFKDFLKSFITKKDFYTVSVDKKKDGTFINVEIKGKFFYLMDKPHLISIIRDISEIEGIKESLISINLRQEAILDAIPDILVEVDNNNVYTHANDIGREFFGDNLIGKNVSDYFVGEQDKLFQVEPLFLNDETIFRFENWQRRKDGEKRLLSWKSKTLKDIKGNVIGVISSARDITERKLSEKFIKEKTDEIYQQNEKLKALNVELNNSKEKAEENDKLKTAFLANMSHEIRTPMNGIMGFSELLSNENISKEQQIKYSEIIMNSSKRLLSLINDILDISKIETKQISVNMAECNISNLFVKLHNFYMPIAKSKNLEFSMQLDIESPFVYSDERKIYQIINNLLDNAFKFTSKGKIILGCKVNHNMLEIWVVDTGIGIKKENQKRIFERFVQSEKRIAVDFGGSGLGLSISKALAELLGGEISVKSEFNKGSTFTLSIPLESNNKSKFVSIKQLSNQEQKVVFEGKKLLIAEDEDINYFYLETILADTGLDIYRAKNGFEAVNFCKENPDIKVIIMDIKMPLMSGIEAAKIIKKQNVNIKIIAYTAFAMIGDSERLLNEGCDDYISKPVKKEELIDKVLNYFQD